MKQSYESLINYDIVRWLAEKLKKKYLISLKDARIIGKILL